MVRRETHRTRQAQGKARFARRVVSQVLNEKCSPWVPTNTTPKTRTTRTRKGKVEGCREALPHHFRRGHHCMHREHHNTGANSINYDGIFFAAALVCPRDRVMYCTGVLYLLLHSSSSAWANAHLLPQCLSSTDKIPPKTEQ